MTIIDWQDLARDDNQKVKLQDYQYTLSDFLNVLIEINSRLIRYVSQDQFDAMLLPRDGLDVVDPYVSIPVYQTVNDQKTGDLIYMVYGNHGDIFFTPYDILELYKLDEPVFFGDFQLLNVNHMPHNAKHAVSYTFSTDSDAFCDWKAALNYDEIFDVYGLDGGGEKGCLMGFFFIT